ncbi:hypothetical protein BO94DRAFT_535100 [Aspergillus sclerotioniger CBS 115572]|uniref:Uncharacterized protein n=1 Tax=Aspergillus sclerotioniger CBS 115572 TaxID=1450535 RepID=A0A317WRZ7_9EURO|nr:hypothetical protein BO94DRAFT_535100 [Aspergillus sclerotioniger CBS 115572]PWY88092.1 hypothetical protein BO94DRAFT_535100 [Aspergillus sclerotioniger CBS 115572]
MGLIKTGIQLAGAYGLLRAGSKAANEYKEKKQSNQNQNQNQNQHYNCHNHHGHGQYQQPQYQQPQYQQTHHQQPQYGYDPRTYPNAGPQYTPPGNNEGYGPVQQNDQRYYASHGR